MKRISAILAALALLVWGLAGCRPTGEVTPTPTPDTTPTSDPTPTAPAPVRLTDGPDTVNLLVYTGNGAVSAVSWDLAAGTLSDPTEPLLTVNAPRQDGWKQPVYAWNGTDRVIAAGEGALTQAAGSPVEVEVFAGAGTSYGAGYRFSLTMADGCGCMLTTGEGTYAISLDDRPRFPQDDGTGNSYAVLTSELADGAFRVYFAYLGAGTGWLFHGTADLAQQEPAMEWSEPVELEAKHFNAVVQYCSPRSCAAAGGKAYLPGNGTLLCWDPETGELSGMEAVTGWMDGLFPGTERVSFQNAVTCGGQWGETAICSIQYGDGSGNRYTVHCAFRDGEVLGALAERSDAHLTAYDKDGKAVAELQAECELLTMPQPQYGG